MKLNIKEKIAAGTGSVSGAASVLGSWQVCHNVCLAIIALLSIIGITVTGMPLLFLTKVAVPLWLTAVLLFLIVLIFYLKRKCISKNLILLNLGFILAGTPEIFIGSFQIFFWILGGFFIIFSIIGFIKNKLKRGRL